MAFTSYFTCTFRGRGQAARPSAPGRRVPSRFRPGEGARPGPAQALRAAPAKVLLSSAGPQAVPGRESGGPACESPGPCGARARSLRPPGTGRGAHGPLSRWGGSPRPGARRAWPSGRATSRSWAPRPRGPAPGPREGAALGGCRPAGSPGSLRLGRLPTPAPRADAERLRRTYTWPQRVRTGWCSTSRHTEQSKDVTGSSGWALRSRARGAAEARADLPLSLLSTEPMAAPRARQRPRAQRRWPGGSAVCAEEGSPGPGGTPPPSTQPAQPSPRAHRARRPPHAAPGSRSPGCSLRALCGLGVQPPGRCGLPALRQITLGCGARSERLQAGPLTERLRRRETRRPGPKAHV